MSLLPAALEAAHAGFAVFPAAPLGKEPHPGIGDWRARPTRDVNIIAAWWARWPAANIAIACKPSGLLVIDCDPPKNECDPDGVDEYAAIWNKHTTAPLFDTRIVRTGRGGLHFLYWWPPDKQSKGAKLHGTVNVDIRCNNGDYGNYVIGPGSLTAAGSSYVVENDREPATCPGWLGQYIVDPPRQPPTPGPVRQRDPLMDGGGEGGTRGILAWLEGVQPGGQDNALAWVVRALRDDGVERGEAGRLLWDVVAGWPCSGAPWSERDVERHIRSTYK